MDSLLSSSAVIVSLSKATKRIFINVQFLLDVTNCPGGQLVTCETTQNLNFCGKCDQLSGVTNRPRFGSFASETKKSTTFRYRSIEMAVRTIFARLRPLARVPGRSSAQEIWKSGGFGETISSRSIGLSTLSVTRLQARLVAQSPLPFRNGILFEKCQRTRWFHSGRISHSQEKSSAEESGVGGDGTISESAFRFTWNEHSKHGGRYRSLLISLSVGLLAVSGTMVVFYFASKNSVLVLAAMSETPTDVVLLACGSFNPPTIMHLRMFELARNFLNKRIGYNVVEGVISPVHHAYGKTGLVAADHRIAMLRLATKNTSWLRIDDWEATQAKWCPTVAVLRHTKETCEKRVMLLCGADLLKSFGVPGVWKPADMEEILRDYGIIVITRFGTDLQSVIDDIPVLSQYRGNIHIVTEKITNEISSTKIREALKNGESIRYFVPDAALEYIYENGLYSSL